MLSKNIHKHSLILLNFAIIFVFDVETAPEHNTGDSRETRIPNFICHIPNMVVGGGGGLGNLPQGNFPVL